MIILGPRRVTARGGRCSHRSPGAVQLCGGRRVKECGGRGASQRCDGVFRARPFRTRQRAGRRIEPAIPTEGSVPASASVMAGAGEVWARSRRRAGTCYGSLPSRPPADGLALTSRPSCASIGAGGSEETVRRPCVSDAQQPATASPPPRRKDKGRYAHCAPLHARHAGALLGAGTHPAARLCAPPCPRIAIARQCGSVGRCLWRWEGLVPPPPGPLFEVTGLSNWFVDRRIDQSKLTKRQ